MIKTDLVGLRVGLVLAAKQLAVATVIADNGPNDDGLGRRLPVTSVDQCAASLGWWFGISDADLLTVLPNLGRWNAGVGHPSNF